MHLPPGCHVWCWGGLVKSHLGTVSLWRLSPNLHGLLALAPGSYATSASLVPALLLGTGCQEDCVNSVRGQQDNPSRKLTSHPQNHQDHCRHHGRQIRLQAQMGGLQAKKTVSQWRFPAGRGAQINIIEDTRPLSPL